MLMVGLLNWLNVWFVWCDDVIVGLLVEFDFSCFDCYFVVLLVMIECW